VATTELSALQKLIGLWMSVSRCSVDRICSDRAKLASL
jgi:hypothetical protein